MYQISNEKFGAFLSELRKEKGFTQKELAEKLFVSDKAVSKWERGLSMPNVALLIPLGDVLEVTVTELLKGARLDDEAPLNKREVEDLVAGSLDLSFQNFMKRKKRRWMAAFFLCMAVTLLEILTLAAMDVPFKELGSSVGIVSGLLLLFAGWLCFFVKELLPGYYDSNQIGYYTQGPFRIHLTGLALNNSNWGPICNLLRFWTLAGAVLTPLACIVTVKLSGFETWTEMNFWVRLLPFLIVLASCYYVGKKYA